MYYVVFEGNGKTLYRTKLGDWTQIKNVAFPHKCKARALNVASQAHDAYMKKFKTANGIRFLVKE
jgi:hypothetical protein